MPTTCQVSLPTPALLQRRSSVPSCRPTRQQCRALELCQHVFVAHAQGHALYIAVMRRACLMTCSARHHIKLTIVPLCKRGINASRLHSRSKRSLECTAFK